MTIATTVDKLPAETLDLEHGAGRAVEAVLVEFARDHDPDTLRTGVHRQPPHLRSHGWHSEMLHGQPVWVRPTWIDEDQVPRRNKLHDY